MGKLVSSQSCTQADASNPVHLGFAGAIQPPSWRTGERSSVAKGALLVRLQPAPAPIGGILRRSGELRDTGIFHQ